MKRLFACSSAPWRAVILYSLWILFKILDMNASNILAEVFLNIIGLLEAINSRIGWNLSRSPNGKLSLAITHFPAKEHEGSLENQHRSLSGLVSPRTQNKYCVPGVAGAGYHRFWASNTSP